MKNLEEGVKSPALSSSFINFKFPADSSKYYGQFSQESKKINIKNEQGEELASAVCYTKYFFQRKMGPVKAVLVTDIRTLNTREALRGWSETLIKEIFKFKEESKADFILFLLSKREEGIFKIFTRPRKKREDQVMFSHFKSLKISFMQGRKFLSEPPLKHLVIRRAKEEDLHALSGFIKRSSEGMLLSRVLGGDALKAELLGWKGMSFNDIALACSHDGEIVGSMGVFSPELESHYVFNDLEDASFLATQQALSLGSWILDQRPVKEGASKPVRFFTHMHFNNRDIFYSLSCWWLKQTQKEKPIFLYPHYKGNLKTKRSENLHIEEFGADLFLIQSADDLKLERLKPGLFSKALDLDLHLLF